MIITCHLCFKKREEGYSPNLSNYLCLFCRLLLCSFLTLINTVRSDGIVSIVCLYETTQGVGGVRTLHGITQNETRTVDFYLNLLMPRNRHVPSAWRVTFFPPSEVNFAYFAFTLLPLQHKYHLGNCLKR